MSAASVARLEELLRIFRLPASATKAELRSAYYTQAKKLHPDVAGKGSAEDFKTLKNHYEEAAHLFRELEPFAHLRGSGGAAGAEGGRSGHSGYGRTSWDPSGQWDPRAFSGNFYGQHGHRAEGKVNFDPRGFRAGQRSHINPDVTGAGYTYEATGSGGTVDGSKMRRAQRPSMTPAQRFRQIVVISSGVAAGFLIMTRLTRTGASVGRVYT